MIGMAITERRAMEALSSMLSKDYLVSEPQILVFGILKDFWTKYNDLPKDSFPGLLEESLTGKKEDYVELVLGYVAHITQLSRSKPVSYILSKVGQAMDRVRIIKDSNEMYRMATSGDVSGAWKLVRQLRQSDLADSHEIYMAEDWTNIIFQQMEREFATGILFFDNNGAYPQRKTLTLFAAPPNRGKSWFLIQVATKNLMLGKKVLYVTLEMDQGQVATRMLMSRYRVPFRDACILGTFLNFEDGGDSRNRLAAAVDNPRGISRLPIQVSNILSNRGVQDKLLHDFRTEYFSRFGVLQYPTRSLTADTLEFLLDQKSIRSGFVPDLICVDYADLMNLDGKARYGEYRHQIYDIYASLRKIAGERNIAVVTASQTNRGAIAAAERDGVSEENYAEAYEAKMGIPDLCITYSQSKGEQKYSLATLILSKVRGYGPVGEAVQIVSNYALGQFCVEDHQIINYRESVKSHLERDAMENSFVSEDP